MKKKNQKVFYRKKKRLWKNFTLMKTITKMITEMPQVMMMEVMTILIMTIIGERYKTCPTSGVR